jgi:hypothetical protein
MELMLTLQQLGASGTCHTQQWQDGSHPSTVCDTIMKSACYPTSVCSHTGDNHRQGQEQVPACMQNKLAKVTLSEGSFKC